MEGYFVAPKVPWASMDHVNRNDVLLLCDSSLHCLSLYFFSLQKKELKAACKVCFFSMMCALLFVAMSNMRLEHDIYYPGKSHKFTNHLPPFCFGMLAALVNFALEQKFNSQQLKTNITEKTYQIKLKKMIS